MHKPHLYLFVGYPGAGKTTVAKLIATQTGATHIWADQERQTMFAEPTHSSAESVELYRYLNDRTSQLLQSGHSVIFDTNFNFRKDRDYLRSIAVRQDAQVVVIWVNTPKDIAKQRAVRDLNLRNGYTDVMTPQQFETIASKLEAPAEDENFIKIDGTKLDEAELKRLLKL